MKKRKATPKQLANLAKGREKLFCNQLKKRGINPNPKPQIVREVIRQPIVNQNTTHQHNLKLQLSLFEKFLGTKFFPIEINKNKENLNITQIINHIFNRLNKQNNLISSNGNKISEIIDFINSREKKYNAKFEKMKKEISELKKENSKLMRDEDDN